MCRKPLFPLLPVAIPSRSMVSPTLRDPLPACRRLAVLSSAPAILTAMLTSFLAALNANTGITAGAANARRRLRQSVTCRLRPVRLLTVAGTTVAIFHCNCRWLQPRSLSSAAPTAQDAANLAAKINAAATVTASAAVRRSPSQPLPARDSSQCRRRQRHFTTRMHTR